jgi:hypothetical protein
MRAGGPIGLFWFLGVLVVSPSAPLHGRTLHNRNQQFWIDKLKRSLAPRHQERAFPRPTLATSTSRKTERPTVEITDDCRGSLDPQLGKRCRLRVYDEKEFVAAATRLSRNKRVGCLMPLYTVIKNGDADGRPTGEVTIIDSRGTRTVKESDAKVFPRAPLNGVRRLFGGLRRTSERSTASGLGDLTRQEAAQIQLVVDRMGCGGLIVGGSAARGGRRNRAKRWLPIGKGPGTRSDIDYFAWQRHLGRIDDLALPDMARHRIVDLNNVYVYDRRREVDIKEAISNKPFIVFQPHHKPRCVAHGALPTFEGPD